MKRPRRSAIQGPRAAPSSAPPAIRAVAEDQTAAAGAVSRENGSAAGTHLTSKEVDAFHALLLARRRELAGDVEHMSREALGKNRQDAAGDLSRMPLHMADIGTDAYEQEFTIGLIKSEEETVREIDAALDRIRGGTYGVCTATGRAIGKTRLKAQPWARFCVQHVRAMERRGRH